MADTITSFFLLPQANRVSGSAAPVLAPSALELGADNLTRNPRAETLGKLFAAPSGSSNISGVDSFLAVHTAGSTTASAKPAAKDGAKQVPELKKNNSAAQDVFIRRETSAEARLKELLKSSTAAAPAAQTNTAAADEEAATPAVTRNTGLRVAEGGEGIINSRRLNTNISGARPQDIIYTINDGPRHGQLELAAKPGAAVTTFTQQDLNLGRLRYVNDGSEARGDSFDFTVTGGEQEISGNFGISVSAVNDAPTIATNEGLTVNEGATATLTTAQLSATDPDNSTADTSFTVTSGPSHGRLEFAGNAGIAITSFTQADVAAGRVRYVSDGSENTADSFNFTAGDGSAVSNEESFAITVNPVDDAPVRTTNTGVTAAEGGAATITAAQLKTTDVDTAAANITYSVTSGPARGRLEFTDNPGGAVNSFTQADIDSGRLRYIHDGSETTSDSFGFSTADASTTLAPANFNINVTPVNDAPTVSIQNATVTEGGAHRLRASELRATDPDTASRNLVYTVTATPTNGHLERRGNAGVAINSFTQADINAGRVSFVHDGSETTSASFDFTVSDGNTTLGGRTLSFTVTPVNDAPTAAANTGISVGRISSTTISNANLRATDVDSPIPSLTYTVTQSVTRGQLELSTNPGQNVTSFTQADIDAGRLRYIHTNLLSGADDSFSFRVSDGSASSPVQTFNITVT